MDECRGYYAEWNKTEKDKYSMVSLIFRIQKERKKTAELTETESRLTVRVWGGGGGWRDVKQRVRTSSYEMSKPGDVMYRMVTTVNSTALYIWKLLRE